MDPSIIGFDLGWGYIQRGITKLKRIIEGLPGTQMSANEYMNLHKTVYYMCNQPPPFNHSQRLYNEYKGVLDEYNISTVLNSIKDKHDECMLKVLVERWLDYKVFVRQLSRFFNYLDRYFVAQHSLPSVNEVGYSSFRDLVYTKVRDDARKSAIALINKERDGEQIDRLLLKNVIDIFVDIGMTEMKYYEEDFEEHLLEDTTDYYKSKAAVWIESDTCPDYMLKVECLLKREKDRVSHYLHSSTEQKLVEKVQHELLMNCVNQLLGKEHSGFRVLIRNDMVDDLSRMYRLYHTIPKGLELVANVFKQHITDEGTNLVQLAEDASKQVLVRKFIELHDKYMAYINNCFMNHTLFHKALKGAFEVFCNKTVAGSSGAELVSSFSDNILKKSGSKEMGDDDIEGTLEKIVMLVAYINDKDHFAEFYRKKLARRLLFNKSANIEHEKFILSQLKLQNGVQFTSKMEGMMQDLTLYKDNQLKFQQYLSENPHVNPGIDLTVAALTTGLWPDYKYSNLKLPSEMANCVEVFKDFYKTKTKNRKLTWIYSLGNCIISGKFELKNIELSVSTYQAAALLLFNTADKLSYSEIMTQLNLTDEEIVRLLHSLSCAKYEILIKEPSTKTISPTDSFEFNSNFTHKLQRIKVPLPPVDERKTDDERKKLVEDVEINRKHAIDAAIVRIMKQKKVCGFQELVSSCVKELMRSFKTDTKAVKKRIEDLITRDYLERDQENSNILKYLA